MTISALFAHFLDLLTDLVPFAGVAAVMPRLENVSETLTKMLTLLELSRLEFHGPAVERDALRGQLTDLNGDFFVVRGGVDRG